MGLEVLPLLKALRAAAALLGGVLAGACSDGGALPHVILISSDTLRADHLSINGYPRATSPNIDAFARRAWHFPQTVTVLPKTSPSIASVFSGRHPREHGVRSNFDALPAEVPVLAERLERLGYRTAAFVGNPVLRAESGFARGFGVYREFTLEQGVGDVNRAFRGWAREPWTQPTFVWIHYLDPHGPYTPSPEDAARFLGDALARSDERVSLDYRSAMRKSGFPNKVLGAVPRYQQVDGEDRVAVYVARYDAEIRRMDAAFGEVVGLLEARGLFDPSVVVFTSDHGESLGEHDLYFEHGWFAYEPTLRVPLMIKEPGQVRGRVVDALASHLDFVPTLAHLVPGLETGKEAGRNLLGPRGTPRRLFVESSDRYPEKYYGLRGARWKYLVRAPGGREELYDLEADPSETRNLKDAQPSVLAEMRGQLSDRLRALRAAGGRPRPADTLYK